MRPEVATFEGRRVAESLMVDECRVWVEGDTEITDPYTGDVTFPRTLVYEGPCKFQTQQAWETEPSSAGAKYTVQRYQLHLPVSAGPVVPGHLVEPTVSLLDPHMVGRVHRVTASYHKTFATAQRVGIMEVTG